MESLLVQRVEQGLKLVERDGGRWRGPKWAGPPQGDLLEADEGWPSRPNLSSNCGCALRDLTGLDLQIRGRHSGYQLPECRGGDDRAEVGRLVHILGHDGHSSAGRGRRLSCYRAGDQPTRHEAG